MSENGIPPRGRIENMGLLNLLSAKSAEDFSAITSIQNVGCVLVPEHLAAAATCIPMENVGAVATIPVDQQINLICGQATLTGDALAQGDPETLLVIAGQVHITTPVIQVGYRGLHVVGQLMAPRGSETAISRALVHLSGQVVYFPEGARMMTGDERIGREFLGYLPGPTPLMVSGVLTFENDVSVDLLREKVSEIMLSGVIRAPRPLLPLIQFLTSEKSGVIEPTDE